MTYRGHAAPVHALRGVDFLVPLGQFVAVLGRSGSGKSTLLHILAGLQKPTAGRVEVGDVSVSALSLDEGARWRRTNLGMIHQFFNLIPTLSVTQNVATPLLLDGHRLRSVKERVDDLLDSLGMADRREHALNELSGGEMQRVAIARALVANPRLVLADEPTGNLDTQTGHVILELLQRATAERGMTLVVVTHDMEVTSYANRVVTMEDGQIQSDTHPVEATAQV
jgi:putative ABC transport system ATP-binding protein